MARVLAFSLVCLLAACATPRERGADPSGDRGGSTGGGTGGGTAGRGGSVGGVGGVGGSGVGGSGGGGGDLGVDASSDRPVATDGASAPGVDAAMAAPEVAPPTDRCAQARCGAPGMDGCCPTGCMAAQDADCVVCGDRIRGGDETCDPLSSCPSRCPPIGCQTRRLEDLGTCRARCVNDALNTTCHDDDGCCPGGCSGTNDTDCAKPNLMFVTSVKYNGNLGGLAGADAKCAERARAAGLPGKFLALLSTSSVAGFSRFAGTRGWVRTDGRPFLNDLTDDFSFYPPNVDESGKQISGGRYDGQVNTGTDRDGKLLEPAACKDWTTDDPGDHTVSSGTANNGSSSWLAFYTQSSCDRLTPLYCLEVGRRAFVAPPPVPPQGTRLAFVSEDYLPGGGILDADQRCADEASAAGVSGEFLALLATAGQSAVSRFNLTGAPWYRPDGIQIVRNAADLAQGHLLAPIDCTLQGQHPRSMVWTGAATAGVPEGGCGDWSMSGGLNQSRFGLSDSTSVSWFDDDQKVICTAKYVRLYCLQK